MKTILSLFIFSCLLVSCSFGPNQGDRIVTRPYTIKGIHYTPMSIQEALYYDEIGTASWYDESKLFGLVRGNTSLGEKVQPFAISGAHKTLPLPCRVRVTNLENGKTLTLRLNDRGPFIDGRIIDLTPRAAQKLGFKDDGLTQVRVETLSVGDPPHQYKSPKENKSFFSKLWPF